MALVLPRYAVIAAPAVAGPCAIVVGPMFNWTVVDQDTPMLNWTVVDQDAPMLNWTVVDQDANGTRGSDRGGDALAAHEHDDAVVVAPARVRPVVRAPFLRAPRAATGCVPVNPHNSGWSRPVINHSGVRTSYKTERVRNGACMRAVKTTKFTRTRRGTGLTSSMVITKTEKTQWHYMRGQDGSYGDLRFPF